MSKENLNWSGGRVMDRWNSSPTELASFIYQGLPAFKMDAGKYHQVKPEDIQRYDENHMTDLLFRPMDIEEFEKQPGFLELMADRAGPLGVGEKRELGELRREKAKWDSSIAAAVQAGCYFANFGREITKAELQEFINKMDDTIPNTTIDKIWKAFPEKYKKTAGRPRKE